MKPLYCIPLIVFVWALCIGRPVVAQVDAVDDGDAMPHWIWGRSDRSPGQSIRFEKAFPIRAAVQRATIHLAADYTSCRVSLNPSVLFQLDAYGPWLEWDVTDQLTLGVNRLSLECHSVAGPAAVAMTLDVAYADGSRDRWVTDSSWDASQGGVISFGLVAEHHWDVANLAKVSAFDDYEQWRRAIGAGTGTDPATFATQPGFQVERVRSAQSDEGSWVSMAFDPEGRITIAREDKGLLRMTLASDGAGVRLVETVNADLLECRGLLYAHDSLYANANNSKGLYRLRDSDGDDQFDQVTLLRQFPGQVGHGRNDLALDEDGMIYSIHGDSVDLAVDRIWDHTSPLERLRAKEPADQGHLIRTDRDGSGWELIATGLRNPFGIDFNAAGEIFTYDADNEYDMGAPWYRPTRLVQLVSGADYGWRRVENGQWPPYYPDHADNALPSVDVGKGSPTAVKSGHRSSFPAPYQNALFVLDWAYGRVLACHLVPRGAGYTSRIETFLAGRPLNVTDLDFDSAGDMYLITGGRKTQSALYRIRYVGPQAAVPQPTAQDLARNQFSDLARRHRQRLADQHRSPDLLVNAIGNPNAKNQRDEPFDAWLDLANPDPMIRNAARVAIEHRPFDQWRDRALSETDPESAATALLMFARAADSKDKVRLLDRLNHMDVLSISGFAKLSLIHAYRLVLDTDSSTGAVASNDALQRLRAWLRSENTMAIAPLGSGSTVQEELARLLADHHVPGVIEPLIQMLRVADDQRERMIALTMLCHQEGPWTLEQRELFFEALAELEKTAFSGAGMPGRLTQLREFAVTGLSDSERTHLGSSVQPTAIDQPAAVAVTRPFVRRWTQGELADALAALPEQADPIRGAILYREVLCVTCHRVAGRGGVIGPDLTSVASRFSTHDILAAILTPSAVIAERYRSTQIVTSDGRVISGQVLTGGDYRSSELRIATDPMDPGKTVTIPKHDIAQHQPSSVSPMPAGLIDTLTADEVADLLAFLVGSPQGLNQRRPVP